MKNIRVKIYGIHDKVSVDAVRVVIENTQEAIFAHVFLDGWAIIKALTPSQLSYIIQALERAQYQISCYSYYVQIS